MRLFFFSYKQVKHDFSLLCPYAIICGRSNITVNWDYLHAQNQGKLANVCLHRFSSIFESTIFMYSGSDTFRYLLRPLQRFNAFAIFVLFVNNTWHIFLLKDTFTSPVISLIFHLQICKHCFVHLLRVFVTLWVQNEIDCRSIKRITAIQTDRIRLTDIYIHYVGALIFWSLFHDHTCVCVLMFWRKLECF